MLAWLLNLIYLLIVLAASPVLLYRSLRYGKYRAGWGEKLWGRLPRFGSVFRGQKTADSSSPANPQSATPAVRVWFHAVSVGEVLQLQTVLREFEQRCPQAEIVVTTTTSTGLAVAKEKFPRHHVCYFPLDFTWAVRNAVARIRPDAVVLVELELWPNFIREVHRRGIPLALINGRISDTSFRGYRRIRPLMRHLLSRFAYLAVQNETYARRLLNLGAPAEKVQVTGSVKFDGVVTDRENRQTAELKAAFGLSPSDPVFIAGSTHAPEEEIALNAWSEARRHHPRLRLILIPRHQERFDEVARLVESRGYPLIRRSTGWNSLIGESRGTRDEGRESRDERQAAIQDPSPDSQFPNRIRKSDSLPVLLLDTLGELSACWGLADVAFVGGSLTSRGGQNMIEPAAYGAAVTFGPNTRNFRDVVALLLDGDAARVVRDAGELAIVLREYLDSPELSRRQGERARRLVAAQQGATSKTVGALIERLGISFETRAASRSRAA